MDATATDPPTPVTRLVRASGNLVLLALVIGLAYGVKVVFETRRDNADAAVFIASTVTAMARNWDATEMIRRAAPEWLQPADQGQLAALFRHFSALGHLKGLQPPIGRVGNGPFPGTRINGVWADYTVIGEFDAGPSAFRMILKREGESWQIAGFQADAPVLNRTPAK